MCLLAKHGCLTKPRKVWGRSETSLRLYASQCAERAQRGRVPLAACKAAFEQLASVSWLNAAD